MCLLPIFHFVSSFFSHPSDNLIQQKIRLWEKGLNRNYENYMPIVVLGLIWFSGGEYRFAVPSLNKFDLIESYYLFGHFVSDLPWWIDNVPISTAVMSSQSECRTPVRSSHSNWIEELTEGGRESWLWRIGKSKFSKLSYMLVPSKGGRIGYKVSQECYKYCIMCSKTLV
jgi:hypothetical protein